MQKRTADLVQGDKIMHEGEIWTVTRLGRARWDARAQEWVVGISRGARHTKRGIRTETITTY
jgi:hypothetical protein